VGAREQQRGCIGAGRGPLRAAASRRSLSPLSLPVHASPRLSISLRALAQVDVYSFGVVLWELWTGREPHEGLNYHALLHQVGGGCGLSVGRVWWI